MPQVNDGAKPVRTERSMLFVPAVRWSMVEKASASAADVVCIDLEDSVPADEKAAGRANVIRAFTELDFGSKARMVRINGLTTPYAYRDIVDIFEAVGDRIDLVMLPKAESPQDVAFVATMLSQIEMHRGFGRPVGIEAQIESASGFVWLREIAQSSPRLEALIFGPGDFAASMHMPSSGIGAFDADDAEYPGHRWHAAMHAIVAAARANGLRCIDGPYGVHTDASGFEKSCRIARGLGFDGKQCIHPGQLAMANSIFSPSADEIAHAQRVLDAYDRAAVDGKGAVSMSGQMIDAANVRMAQMVMAQQRRAGTGS